MASVYRKQNRWWIHFKDGTGRWRDISTKVDTKTAAKVMAKELEHRAERQRRGLDPVHDPRRKVTLGEVMNIWWTEYGSKLRSTTINLFAEKHVRKALGHLALVELTSGKIETFLNKKLEELRLPGRSTISAATCGGCSTSPSRSTSGRAPTPSLTWKRPTCRRP